MQSMFKLHTVHTFPLSMHTYNLSLNLTITNACKVNMNDLPGRMQGNGNDDL